MLNFPLSKEGSQANVGVEDVDGDQAELKSDEMDTEPPDPI